MAQRIAQSGASRIALAICVGFALVLLAGCVSTVEERARDFNEDGVHLFAQGNYAAALDSFDLALTFRPQDPTLLFNVAECCDRLGDVKAAEKYYGSCLMRAPKHGDARIALVALLYRTERKAEADRLIADWLAQDGQSADAFILEAWRLRQAKAYPEAQGRLQQALDVEPHNRRALAEMAYLYELTGMPQRAYVLYERILEREPEQAQIAQKLDQLKLKGVSRPLPD
jgi:tetratricopeptide (TPR) repeat protein